MRDRCESVVWADVDVAESVLEGILNARPIGMDGIYHATLILADRGQTENVSKILKLALRNKATFPDRQEAERILQHLAQVGTPKTFANTEK